MKKNFKIFALVVGIGLVNISGFAQKRMVTNTSYALMLKTLLGHTVPEISVSEVTKSKERSIVYVDAREPREYEVSHLKNAVFVGYDNLDFSRLKNVNKNQEIVVYCSVGYRSEKVAEKLLKMGFTNIKNLYGGIFEWKNQGYDVENLKGSTEEIHAFSESWGIWLKKGNKIYK